MCGLVRMDCYRNGILNVIHVEKKDAARVARQRSREGWVIAHTVEL